MQSLRQQPSIQESRKNAGAKKLVGMIKHRDNADHTCTGYFKRLNLYLAALANGKSAEDLLV